jgi:hypothetical protein
MDNNIERYYTIPYTIKADWKGSLVPIVIFDLPMVCAVFALRQIVPIWVNVIIISFIPLLFWGLLSTFEIKITEDRIIYKEFFIKNIEMLYSNIISVKFASGVCQTSGWGHGFFRLVIHDKAKDEPLIVNMKILTKRDLAILVDALLTKNSSIKTDKSVDKIRATKLNEVILTSLRINVAQIFWILFSMTIGIALISRIFFKK